MKIKIIQTGLLILSISLTCTTVLANGGMPLPTVNGSIAPQRMFYPDSTKQMYNIERNYHTNSAIYKMEKKEADKKQKEEAKKKAKETIEDTEQQQAEAQQNLQQNMQPYVKETEAKFLKPVDKNDKSEKGLRGLFKGFTVEW